MMPRLRPALMLVCLLWAAAAAARAPTSAAGAAPPDTLTAVLTAPAGTPTPRLSLAAPDTLLFGAPLRLALDFGGAAPAPADSIRSATPWLHVAAAVADDEGNVVLELRCWRAGPWRLAWADPSRAGEVLVTAGRLAPEAPPAPVRDPWRPARDLRLLSLAALLAAVLLLAALLAWRRRGRGLRVLVDAPPPPAWARFAADLAPALAEGQPRSGETGVYLTVLGGALRTYLARRYGVTASGLTGGDVSGAVTARQYQAERVAVFDELLAECDRLRFDPRPPSPDRCRRLTAAAVGAVARDREGVAPADAAAAARWARLREAVQAWTGEDPAAVAGEVGRA